MTGIPSLQTSRTFTIPSIVTIPSPPGGAACSLHMRTSPYDLICENLQLRLANLHKRNLQDTAPPPPCFPYPMVAAASVSPAPPCFPPDRPPRWSWRDKIVSEVVHSQQEVDDHPSFFLSEVWLPYTYRVTSRPVGITRIHVLFTSKEAHTHWAHTHTRTYMH